MKLGFIGLGRMGYNMVLSLLEKKHEVVVYDRIPDQIKKLSDKGAIPSNSLKELLDLLPERKIIWIMITAGKPIDDTLSQLIPILGKGDIIIDGGNSYHEESIRRYKELKKKGIHFLDCGTSGGMGGARNGACIMVGGDKEAFKAVEPIIKSLSVKDGYSYLGKSGSGHFVKMVHNGIEYGMMASIAEGMQAIKEISPDIDLNEVAKVYAHGSIIESRLMSWTEDSYNAPGYLDSISGSVPRGETEEEMENLENKSPTEMKILKEARLMRANSRTKPSYAGKLVSAMRNQFGGHAVNKENGKNKKK
ncbi:MAG: decarboxylating 6-phosphogluconate dehydrogenase [archaeon]